MKDTTIIDQFLPTFCFQIHPNKLKVKGMRDESKK